MTTNWAVLGLIFLLGGFGSLLSAFVGDNGWHLPKVEEGVFRPGYLGNMLVGSAAAVASWGMVRSALLIGPGAIHLTFSTSDLANALLIGFGGASWFKSQLERTILQKTAAIVATKAPDSDAAARIATSTPIEALRQAKQLPAGQSC